MDNDDNDDLYDVPRPQNTTQEIPPSLPPKKSSKSLSFNEWDGLSSGSKDPRPKPMPRKMLRCSSSRSSKVTSPTISAQELTAPSTGPTQQFPTPSNASAQLFPSMAAASKPTPRPRPRWHNAKCPDLTADAQLEQNLPPSADEVEEMVNQMVEKQLAQEEEERIKKHSQQPEAHCMVQSSDSSVDALGGQDAGQHEVQNSNKTLGEGASETNIDCLASDEEADYENRETIQSLLKPKPANVRTDLKTGFCTQGLDMFNDAFGESNSNEYAQVQRHKGADPGKSQLETEFDPFAKPQANPSGLPLLPGDGGMLQPTKVWENPGYEQGANLGGQGKATESGPYDSHRDSSTYETLWCSKTQENWPGMVKPQSGKMVFTPKHPQDGTVPQPVYTGHTGEYIKLDPTYNIPPPSLPPPPLPPQAVISSRPPSIPPRPVNIKPPDSQDNLILQGSSSHRGESSADGQGCVSKNPTSTVFESLPTPAPGFQTPFDSDDPFKNSVFGSECQEFNYPLSTSHADMTVKDDESSIYEISDSNDFVVDWTKMTGADMDSTYQEVGTEIGRSDSFRLSQVPPPPPRHHGRGQGTEVSAASAARNAPSPRSNLYSLAKTDDELSQSVGSSDSSEDLFNEGNFDGYRSSRTLSTYGPISIVPSEQPRKTERHGYLYKQGGVKANRGWRLRWVIFNGKDLRYYDNNRSQISKKIIPLSSMKEVISDIRESDTNRFKFRLVTTLRDRTFLFAADSRDDCCNWTSTLMAAILQNKADGPDVETEPKKPDKEGFIRFENNNKKFYVAIWGKTLCYYDTFEDFQMQCPVHEIDMKLSSVKDKKKNRLQLSTHYAYFSLMFDSLQEAQSWRMAIEDAIAEGLADDSVLEKVYENEANRICADCEEENPHWASINLGIVLCKKCAGIHRMFESSISKIRSLRMDTRVWTPSLIELMKAIGNGNANLFWEHDLLPIQKISKDSLPEERKQFAQLKYKQKRYSNQHSLAHDKRQLNEALLQVSSTNDLLETMRIIFSGADLSYSGGPAKQNAYQTAKQHGQRLLMELLYQNGGDCSNIEEGSLSNEGRLREDVRLQGYLMKTGPAGRTFDQRWCVLEHGSLTYYLNDKSTTAKDSIDRKSIICLQDVTSERQENVFEVSTMKSGNRVYTFAAESANERGMWMRTLGKLISPVAVMEHVGMMDFSLAALVFMRESVSEDWRQTWIMLSWRLLYFMNKDLKLDHIDLRKATQIKFSHTASCPMCLEKGTCFVLSSPGKTFYIQATLQRDTSRILECVSAFMKQSGRSLLDQQLTGDSVPVIVDKCLTQVLSRGRGEQGIYRKAATHSRVENLIEELKKDAHAVRLDDYDIHEVANALKRFLRGLEDSLFMRERYSEWIRTSSAEDEHNKLLWYRYLLEKLPLVNYNTLRHIVLHIKEMAQYDNNMTIESLCTCFAPTLMCTENDPVRGTSAGSEIKVLLDLVNQRDYLFQINQEELDHEAKIQEATKKIQQAQQDVRRSQPSNTFLMPVSMYSHNGQCEMVNVTVDTTAQDVVDYLTRKCSLSGRCFALTEVIFKGALVRPLFPSNNILMTTGRWGDWDEAIRKEMCLCLMDTDTMEKLDRHYDNSRALSGEVKYADNKSKTKFRKVTVEFKQCVLTFYKDPRANRHLCSWKVEDLIIYLGIDPKRSPPNNFGFTFLVNNRDEKSKNSCFGHCISLSSEEEMYRWVSALLVTQNPEGLLAWNK